MKQTRVWVRAMCLGIAVLMIVSMIAGVAWQLV